MKITTIMIHPSIKLRNQYRLLPHLPKLSAVMTAYYLIFVGTSFCIFCCCCTTANAQRQVDNEGMEMYPHHQLRHQVVAADSTSNSNTAGDNDSSPSTTTTTLFRTRRKSNPLKQTAKARKKNDKNSNIKNNNNNNNNNNKNNKAGGAASAFVASQAVSKPINNNKPSNSKPSNNSNSKPSNSKPSTSTNNTTTNNNSNNIANTIAINKQTISLLAAKASRINNELFLYENPSLGRYEPSTIYKHSGLEKALQVMMRNSKGGGVNGIYFYLGADAHPTESRGSKYGLVNVAAFLAQSMKETIKYNACDENNWDLVNGKYYAISNACGQLGQSYQDYHCSPEERHMECPVNKNMKITAVTHANWYGAPGPLYCGPKENSRDVTGFWDYMYECNNPWATPPKKCDVYPGQRAGQYDNSKKVANVAGRTDVEGCCWWGRGVIQTTGVCNFGKLNYHLGKRAAKEGRDSAYPEIDFCKDPEVICSSKEHAELKWIAGLFYWMESVQSYNVRGWNYMSQLRAFVDGGLSDPSFIDAVSGIVNRGCHDPPCGTGDVDGLIERSSNFDKALKVFGVTA